MIMATAAPQDAHSIGPYAPDSLSASAGLNKDNNPRESGGEGDDESWKEHLIPHIPIPQRKPPLTGVKVLRDADILCGRGGANLRHPGNCVYRQLVNDNKPLYSTCPKDEKLNISRSIVAVIRERGGRFLDRPGSFSVVKDSNGGGGGGAWFDIGDSKALLKTSQALREGQPRLLLRMKEMKDAVGSVALRALEARGPSRIVAVMAGDADYDQGEGLLQPDPITRAEREGRVPRIAMEALQRPSTGFSTKKSSTYNATNSALLKVIHANDAVSKSLEPDFWASSANTSFESDRSGDKGESNTQSQCNHVAGADVSISSLIEPDILHISKTDIRRPCMYIVPDQDEKELGAGRTGIQNTLILR